MATAATTCSKPKPAPSRDRAFYDGSGIPLDEDNESVIKERIYLDKADRNLLHDEITVFDHALTRPWTVMKTYRRTLDPLADWPEYICNEQIPYIHLGNEVYKIGEDGHLVPTRQNQPPPDLHYFDRRSRESPLVWQRFRTKLRSNHGYTERSSALPHWRHRFA